MKAIKLLLRGRVQGVGFRYFVMKVAEKLHIKGYVRNLPDGSVEVVYIPVDKKSQEEFEKKVKKGPFLAQVESVEKTEVSLSEEMHNFEIRY